MDSIAIDELARGMRTDATRRARRQRLRRAAGYVLAAVVGALAVLVFV